MVMDEGEDGIDIRRVLCINVDADGELHRFKRSVGDVPCRFGFDVVMRDNAEGDFFVDSRIRQVSKLERA
jgi:hypothetical protein